MKYPLLALFVVISAIALPHPADASEEEVPPVITYGAQAAALVTKPITINNGAGNTLDRTSNLRQIAGSIASARQGECKKITPRDLINDPSAIFKQCQKPTNNQISQSNAEPIEYFKVPRLDSGISVTVTKF
ncbi:hypothetical protein A6770_12300 [Nostoc minutum NIES-26]|uniref:Uncharacterized protein n=1 Tax=Nostoc minutum NIES-26 TaxID=1844469 RepID=A0A367RRU7_9NOSO|nr:hypothetical protein A6770_12300 [Nostoc minutum NIES-26]